MTRFSAGALATGPCVIGATGGSGTRVVARIVREAGVYLGRRLNKSEDTLDFGEYSDRWVTPFWTDGPAVVRERMTRDLDGVLARHLDRHDSGGAWGWKEPRSIYLVGFFAEAMPALRFLHVVRDGRDMAFSSNQRQLTLYGGIFLPEEAAAWPEAERSIALWQEVNLRAAEFGERQLKDRYARIRFEDLCAEPEPVIGRVLDLFGLEGDARRLKRHVKPPRTLERWRAESPARVGRLETIAAGALDRFGYTTGTER